VSHQLILIAAGQDMSGFVVGSSRSPDPLKRHYYEMLDSSAWLRDVRTLPSRSLNVTRSVRPRSYGLPGSLAEYLPDASEPIDRWYQAANSSNVRTTWAIISDLCADRRPTALLDPFAGAGSLAVVARLAGIPFFGIELDPLLACVTAAKALATGGPSEGTRGNLVQDCLDIVGQMSAGQVSAVGQMSAGQASAVGQMSAGQVSAAQGAAEQNRFAADLAFAPEPSGQNRVVWGDATDPAAWRPLSEGYEFPVLYTSPPFGGGPLRRPASEPLRFAAEKVLTAMGMRHGRIPDGAFGSYADLVIGMVRNAAKALPAGLIVIDPPPGLLEDE